MRSRLAGLRESYSVLGLLAVAWLPYISTRCIESQHDGSRGSPPPHHVAAGHPHGAEHSDHAHDAAPSDEPSRDPCERTCCELTGKCAIVVAARGPSGDPPLLLAVLVPAVDAPAVSPRLPRTRPISSLAHGPPAYLRHASLLI